MVFRTTFLQLLYKHLFGFLILGLFLHLPQSALFAQVTDSMSNPEPVVVTKTVYPDSVLRFNVKRPSPKRAGLYSACIPGLGQLYNKQYWKAGVVYAGAAVIGGFVVSNYQEYTKYRKIYIGMIDSNPNTPNTFENLTSEDVKYLRDGFRRYLEYSVIASVAGYIMNILDAFISGHLRTFDMSKDISFKVQPMSQYPQSPGVQIGFCVHY